MHRVERLEQLLAEAAQRGYVVRQEWLGGRGGGACEIAGRKHLFVDLALSTAEQLAQISEALAECVGNQPQPTQRALGSTKAA